MDTLFCTCQHVSSIIAIFFSHFSKVTARGLATWHQLAEISGQLDRDRYRFRLRYRLPILSLSSRYRYPYRILGGSHQMLHRSTVALRQLSEAVPPHFAHMTVYVLHRSRALQCEDSICSIHVRLPYMKLTSSPQVLKREERGERNNGTEVSKTHSHQIRLENNGLS